MPVKDGELTSLTWKISVLVENVAMNEKKRRRERPAIPLVSTPATVYVVGQDAEVLRSDGTWSLCNVLDVDTDGTLTVETADGMVTKRIRADKQASCLRSTDLQAKRLATCAKKLLKSIESAPPERKTRALKDVLEGLHADLVDAASGVDVLIRHYDKHSNHRRCGEVDPWQGLEDLAHEDYMNWFEDFFQLPCSQEVYSRQQSPMQPIPTASTALTVSSSSSLSSPRRQRLEPPNWNHTASTTMSPSSSSQSATKAPIRGKDLGQVPADNLLDHCFQTAVWAKADSVSSSDCATHRSAAHSAATSLNNTRSSVPLPISRFYIESQIQSSGDEGAGQSPNAPTVCVTPPAAKASILAKTGSQKCFGAFASTCSPVSGSRHSRAGSMSPKKSPTSASTAVASGTNSGFSLSSPSSPPSLRTSIEPTSWTSIDQNDRISLLPTNLDQIRTDRGVDCGIR